MDNSRLDPERIAELIRFRPSDVANAINGIGDLTEYDIRVALSKQATLGTIKGLRLLEYPEAVKDAMAIVKSHYNSEKIRKKRNRNIALFGLPVVAAAGGLAWGGITFKDDISNMVYNALHTPLEAENHCSAEYLEKNLMSAGLANDKSGKIERGNLGGKLYIHFDTNKSNPDIEDMADIKTWVRTLNEICPVGNVGYSINIIGYADNTGSTKANNDLSQRRAEEVRKNLSDLLQVTMTIQPFGESLSTRGESQQYRRVVVHPLFDANTAKGILPPSQRP